MQAKSKAFTASSIQLMHLCVYFAGWLYVCVSIDFLYLQRIWTSLSETVNTQKWKNFCKDETYICCAKIL